MSEREKLVGEAYEELSRFAGYIVRYQAGGDRHAEHECKMVFANSLITLILSAVRDGRLKLDGEVGRFKMRHPMNELDDGDILIALSGTGKEEEK